MNMPYVTKRFNGFSLIELSIVLAILGVMFLAVPSVIPTIKQIFVADNDVQTLDRAESSIKGFLKAQSRLPCPDSNADGIEDCGVGVDVGLLPYKTLKLSSPVKNGFGQPIAYSVYRKSSSTANLDADLASLKNRFSPILPNAEVSTNSNGLDFCWALKNAIGTTNSNSFSYVGSSSTPYNQAFVLASPGASNANNAGTFFDGINQINSRGFELPNKVIDSNYDDTVRSVGFAQLAGELQCSTLIGRVNSSARTRFAMYDLKRLMDYTVDFRALALNVQEGNVKQAEFVQALAILNAAIYTAQTVIAIAEGAESFGVAVAAIAVPAVTAGLLTAKGLIDAANGLSDAKAARDVASAQKTEANAQKVDIDALYLAKLAEAKAVDAKGWF